MPAKTDGFEDLPQGLRSLDKIGGHVQLVEMIIPTAAVARLHLVGIVQAVECRLRDVNTPGKGLSG